MKITIFNNVCILKYCSDEEKLGDKFIDEYLTGEEIKKEYSMGRSKKSRVPVKMLLEKEFDGEKSIYFTTGLYEIAKKRNDKLVQEYLIKEEDERTNEYSADELNFSNYSDELKGILQPESGFNLREDQVTAVFKALRLKRGLVQHPTGTGKTEIMSGIIKYLTKKYSGIKILVIEPTDILVNNTVKRFCRYNLDAIAYKNTRQEIINSVIVSHPMALINDLRQNSELLSGINVIMYDEGHHVQCATWSYLNICIANAEYVLAFSALAVTKEHRNELDVKKLDLEEAQVLGVVTKIISEVSPRYFIDKKILATPVIVQFKSKIVEGGYTNSNWQVLKKKILESAERIRLASLAVSILVKYGRRTLILVDTKEQAFKTLMILADEFNLGKDVGLAFGMNEGWLLNSEGYVSNSAKNSSKTNEKVRLKTIKENLVRASDITEMFDRKEFNILVATSVADEGLDLDQLDAVMLIAAGKKDRRYIQRVGRAIRKSKTGKFGYILDFYDSGNAILAYHSRERMTIYRELIEAYEDCIYPNFEPSCFETLFRHLEEIK